MADDNAKTIRPMRQGDAMQRAAHGWHLRVMGRTWQQIADELGYANGPNAHRAVMRFAGTVPDPEPATLRKLWRARMEQLYSFAARDAEKARPGAIRAGVAVAQRAAALDGLDAPARIEVSGGAAELDAMVRAILAASGEPIELEADVFAVDAEVVDDD